MSERVRTMQSARRDPITSQVQPREELDETTKLVRALFSFSNDYCQVSRGTGHAAIAERARKRVHEALLVCQRDAIDELYDGNTGDRMREMEKFSASLEAAQVDIGGGR